MAKIETRDNHLVPQVYLRQWSQDGNTLFQYNTIRYDEKQPSWTRESIERVGYWRDFYSVITDDGIDGSIDALFGEKYEHPSKRVFDSVSSGLPLSDDDIRVLSEFACLQMVRTPAWFMYMNQCSELLFERTMDEETERIDRELRHAKEEARQPVVPTASTITNPPFPEPPLNVETDGQDIVVSMPNNREHYLWLVGRQLNGFVMNTMRSHQWRILKMPSGRKLPTCDNPLVRLRSHSSGTYTLDGNIGSEDTSLFMPISQNCLLFCAVGNQAFDINGTLVDEKTADLVIRAITMNATRYIYADEERDDIPKIRPSQASLERAKNASYIMTNWNDLQTGPKS